MTPNIQNLPKEVVLSIFKEMNACDLRQCRQVCRSWYSLLLLESFVLDSLTDMQQFITSFDHNSNHSRCAAVKKLYLFTKNSVPASYYFDKETINKLFFQFPNLTEICFRCYTNSLCEFTDEICQELANTCTKLEKFKVDIINKYNFHYLEAIHKIRLLLTSIDKQDIDCAPVHGQTPVQFLSMFPRLDTIVEISKHFTSFEDFLPLLLQLPKLKSFYLGEVDVGTDFAENYFVTITNKEQESIVETLSKVRQIDYSRPDKFCPNLMMFASKYLTGLTHLNIHIRNNSGRTRIHEQVFCDNMLDLFCSVKTNSTLFLEKMDSTVFWRFFPTVVYKNLYSAPPSCMNVILTVQLKKAKLMDLVGILIKSNQKQFRREISIKANQKCQLHGIVDKIRETASMLLHVQELQLEIDDKENYKHTLGFRVYENLFEAMPSLKVIVLDIPRNFTGKRFDADQHDYHGLALSKVENITLRTAHNTDIQTLLNKYYFMFPNLMHLTLQYFCGIPNNSTGECHVDLKRYSLKTLDIDITPVIKAVEDSWLRIDKSYFVLDLHCNGEQQVYKIALDLSSFSSLAKDDNNNYYRVRVTLAHLRRLKLYAFNNILLDSKQDNYFQDSSCCVHIKCLALFE